MTADPGDETVGDDIDASDGESADPDDGESAVTESDADSWKFELDEVDEDGVVDDRETIESGSPSLEHSVFVLLGALVTIGIIVRVAMVFGV
jgi:hypothetical protein